MQGQAGGCVHRPCGCICDDNLSGVGNRDGIEECLKCNSPTFGRNEGGRPAGRRGLVATGLRYKDEIRLQTVDRANSPAMPLVARCEGCVCLMPTNGIHDRDPASRTVWLDEGN